MRVSNQQMVSGALNQAKAQLAALMRAESQLSTGQRVSVPSDDPGASASILLLQAATQTNAQERLNAEDGQAWVNGTDNQLQQAATILQRVRDLAVQAGSSVSPSTSLLYSHNDMRRGGRSPRNTASIYVSIRRTSWMR